MNISQTSSTGAKVCKLAPDYIGAKHEQIT